MRSKAPVGLRIFQIGLWLLALGAVAYLVLPRFLPGSRPIPSASVAASGTLLGPGVAMNAPFQLVNEDGKAVTEAHFAGKPGSWFYGFTNCPDVCPTALAEIAGLLSQPGPGAGKLNAVFVEAMAKSRFVQFAKVRQDGGAYVMQHPASIYLADAKGDFAGTLDAEEPMDTKLSKLKKLVGA